jgi:hypothetical protein
MAALTVFALPIAQGMEVDDRVEAYTPNDDNSDVSYGGNKNMQDS